VTGARRDFLDQFTVNIDRRLASSPSRPGRAPCPATRGWPLILAALALTFRWRQLSRVYVHGRRTHFGRDRRACPSAIADRSAHRGRGRPTSALGPPLAEVVGA